MVQLFFLSLISFLLIFQVYLTTESDTRIKASVSNFYHNFLNEPSTTFCSSYLINKYKENLEHIHQRLLEDTPCLVVTKTDVEENATVNIYDATCGSQTVSWKFYQFNDTDKSTGCIKNTYKIEFTPTQVTPNMYIYTCGLFISVAIVFLYFLFNNLSLSFYIASSTSIIHFTFYFFTRSVDSDFFIQNVCLQCALTLVCLSMNILINFSMLQPNKMYIAPIVISPFFISMLCGSNCPSFSNFFNTIRTSFSLLFADYVYPSFLEFTVVDNLNNFIAFIYVVTYLMFCLVCLVNFASERYEQFKHKLFEYKCEETYKKTDQ